MNSNISPELIPKAIAIRQLIHQFIQERRDAKLEKLKTDDSAELESQEAKIRLAHIPSTWLKDAAKRAAQLKAVTHSIKPMHGDAKGTSVFASFDQLAPQQYVGTNCIKTPKIDVVGNAAALDVFKLLQKSVNEESFLQLAVQKDPALSSAISDDASEGADIAAAFASLVETPDKATSHTLAKQVYWPISNDVHNNEQFRLVSPLYPTSLMHSVFEQIQTDRFSENAKAGREARRNGEASTFEIHEYPNLAFLELGGSKPQNISQLNSERGGKSYMLASLPPAWKANAYRPVLHQKSMFTALYREPGAAKLLRDFRTFIASEPRPVIATRQRVRDYIEKLVEVFMNFTGQMRNLESGWSLNDSCLLNLTEKIWLDEVAMVEHLRANGESIPQTVSEDVCTAFSLWVNERIRSKTIPMGDDESLEWARYLRREISTELRECLDFDSEEQTE
jgi:CRISPR-associated protein Csy1